MRFNPLKILLLTAILAVSFQLQNAAAQPSPENNQDPLLSQAFLDDRYLFTDAGAAAQGDAASDAQFGVVRKRNVEINGDLLAGGPRAGAQAASDGSAADDRKVVLNLFDDVNLIAVVDKVDFTDKGVNWVGKVEGDPKSSVIIVTQDGVCSGNVRYLGKYYEIRYNASQVHSVAEVDEGQLPDEAPPILQEEVPLSGDERGPAGEATGTEAPLDDGAVASPDNGSIIDVMVLYTPAARVARGGVAGIESLITLAMLETSNAYDNSNISPNLRLVNMEETVGYVEAANFVDDLYRLTNTSDGYMDEAHTLRDVYGADLVALITAGSSQYCGVGWILQVLDPLQSQDIGFSVTRHNCATGNYTFGHELGHNQGCRHDVANAGSAGAFPYSYGYQEPSGNFRTVMAYNCPGSCPRVQHFSNPDVDYFGQATGTATADNARSIDDTAITVANYRESSNAGQLPVMQSPTPGSEIGDPNQVFTWTTTGIVTDHWLYIGTVPASNNIFDSLPLGTATSVQASGIPQDGSTIYVRLWYQIDGVWGFIDYSYTTDTAPTGAGEIQSPTPGSTLNSNPVTVTWTPGQGAIQHWLIVGTIPGGSDIDAVGGTAATSGIVNVPLNGNPVYMEVWTEVTGGAWVSEGSVQYQTVSSPGGPEFITSPTPGSQITTTSVTFAWDPGVNVTDGWLCVGTVSGGCSLASTTTAGKTQETVNGIPIAAGGNLYAQIWSEVNGTWETAGPAVYTLVDPRSPSEIQSPTAGSTLSGSPVTFTWDAGQGVVEGWLIVGTTVGGAEIAAVQYFPGTTQASVAVPLTGNPVYAEIWCHLGGGDWESAGPVQYNTTSGVPTILSPTPGSTLTSNPVTFVGSSGQGVLESWLIVGTTVGGSDIAAVNITGTNQANVTVPLTGNPVYAEIWANVSGTWLSDGPVTYQTQ